jgi:hypothetical protein
MTGPRSRREDPLEEDLCRQPNRLRNTCFLGLGIRTEQAPGRIKDIEHQPILLAENKICARCLGGDLLHPGAGTVKSLDGIQPLWVLVAVMPLKDIEGG